MLVARVHLGSLIACCLIQHTCFSPHCEQIFWTSTIDYIKRLWSTSTIGYIKRFWSTLTTDYIKRFWSTSTIGYIKRLWSTSTIGYIKRFWSTSTTDYIKRLWSTSTIGYIKSFCFYIEYRLYQNILVYIDCWLYQKILCCSLRRKACPGEILDSIEYGDMQVTYIKSISRNKFVCPTLRNDVHWYDEADVLCLSVEPRKAEGSNKRVWRCYQILRIIVQVYYKKERRYMNFLKCCFVINRRILYIYLIFFDLNQLYHDQWVLLSILVCFKINLTF